MVLLRHQAGHTAHHQLIVQAIFCPQLCPHLRPVAKAVQVDGVAQGHAPGIPRALSKVVDAGLPPAGPVIGGRAGNELFAEPFDRQLGVLGQTGVVGVGDAHRQARLFSAFQRKKLHGLVVGVQHLDLRVLGQQLLHRAQVGRVALRGYARALEDAPAQCADLVIKKAGLFLVDQKIELEPRAVQMPVIVHQHRLDAAPVHVADRLQDMDHEELPFSRYCARMRRCTSCAEGGCHVCFWAEGSFVGFAKQQTASGIMRRPMVHQK